MSHIICILPKYFDLQFLQFITINFEYFDKLGSHTFAFYIQVHHAQVSPEEKIDFTRSSKFTLPSLKIQREEYIHQSEIKLEGLQKFIDSSTFVVVDCSIVFSDSILIIR